MKKAKLSASFAKQLLKKPFEQIEYELKQPRTPNDAMEQGNRWEHVIIHGLDDLVVWEQTKTKGDKFKAFKKEQQCEPYLVVSKSEYESTKLMFNNVSDEVKQIVKNSIYQHYFKFDNTHGYMDFVTKDIIYDMKVSDINPEKFAKQVINMGWDIQAYVYKKAFDFERDFKWIVVSPEAPHVNRIFNCDQKFIDSGKMKYQKAEILFNEFNSEYDKGIEFELSPPNWLG